MIQFLIRHFVPDHEQTQQPQVRQRYGVLAAVVGILSNIFLFLIKALVGLLFHSISITADAVNNLSDAGSSVISLIGFKLASQKPDKDHPFGHGRFEYISGLKSPANLPTPSIRMDTPAWSTSPAWWFPLSSSC